MYNSKPGDISHSRLDPRLFVATVAVVGTFFVVGGVPFLQEVVQLLPHL